MGEYANFKGQSIKLGTCESLYYVRYFDAVKAVKSAHLIAEEGSVDPHDIIKSGSGYRFRFPFPDEDTVIMGNYDPFKSFTVSFPTSLPVHLPHKDITFRHEISCKYGGVNPKNAVPIIVKIPCPYDPEKQQPDNVHAGVDGKRTIELIFQRLVGEELQTIAKCPCCGSMARLDKIEATFLHDFMIENARLIDFHNADLVKTVAKRMLAGYSLKFDLDEGE